MEAQATYKADTLASAGYIDGTWRAVPDGSYLWDPPQLTNDLQGGDFAVNFILRPKVQLAVSVGFTGIASVTATGSVAITPTIGLNLAVNTARRRLTEGASGSEPGVFGAVLTSVAQRGKLAKVALSSPKRVEHLVFKLSAPSCWLDKSALVLNDVAVPKGDSTVTLPIPWHLYLTPCEHFIFEAFEAGSLSPVLTSDPFPIVMDPCSAPSPLITRFEIV
jgi:hypothetical protein